MKFSEQWLREWVNPDVDSEGLAHQLTLAGLEVDAVEPVVEPFEGVIVARIKSAKQHPDADRLRVCEVEYGEEGTVQIVCGAPNARDGLVAPLAILGARLPGDFKIKKAKLRGVESQGMLCSPKELGLAEDADGLMELPSDAPIGEDFRTYLMLEDTSIDVDLTPNRADCLSIRGIATDVAAVNGLALEAPPVRSVFPAHDDGLDIELNAPDDCPRYVGRVIRGIDPSAESPLWLRERLRRSGLRPISPVVDVTNYVMLEQGQPMHAFDYDTLDGPIGVRRGTSDESLTLLDGRDVELNDGLLIITDNDRPVALAGIMGGLTTSVTDKTTNIFFESAYFSPAVVMGKARALGMHTDASHRFERGVDPEGQSRAIDRATALLIDIAGGEAGPVIESCQADSLPIAPEVSLRHDRISRVLGVEVPADEVVSILERLGMTVDGSPTRWTVTPPSWRFDIAIEEDLIEEVGRIFGFDRILDAPLKGETVIADDAEAELSAIDLRRVLTGQGYSEAINYSFIAQEKLDAVGVGQGAWPLANPLSADLSVLRTRLFPALLDNLAFNINRQATTVRLFETGVVFGEKDGEVDEHNHLALLAHGHRDLEQWGSRHARIDFYDLKGDLEILFDSTRVGSEFECLPASYEWLHPVQAAEIRRDDLVVGWMGALHPKLAAELDASGPVLIAELNLDQVRHGALPEAGGISKYPEVRRDIAIIVRDNVEWWAVVGAIHEAGPKHLQEVRLFDIYRGEGIEKGYKSLAMGLFFQHSERTLTDGEIDDVVASVVQRLEEDLDAKLRG